MALDNAKNFALVTVSTGYGSTDTTIVLAAGNGALLPTPPFNATWWNSTDYSTPTLDPNVEIVRVTNIATDTLTVTRGQESISASTKNTASKTYQMIAGLTAKTINNDLPFVMTQAVVTGSRSFGVTYHNTSGRPMFVSVTDLNVGAANFYANSDSSSSPSTTVSYINTPVAVDRTVLNFFVLAGNYYKVIEDGGGSVSIWTEWTITNP